MTCELAQVISDLRSRIFGPAYPHQQDRSAYRSKCGTHHQVDRTASQQIRISDATRPRFRLSKLQTTHACSHQPQQNHPTPQLRNRRYERPKLDSIPPEVQRRLFLPHHNSLTPATTTHSTHLAHYQRSQKTGTCIVQPQLPSADFDSSECSA